MIRKTLIAAAALAALTSGFAGSAEAKISANGLSVNAAYSNSVKLNAALANTVKFNSLAAHGTEAQNAAPMLEGILLPSGVILLAR